MKKSLLVAKLESILSAAKALMEEVDPDHEMLMEGEKEGSPRKRISKPDTQPEPAVVEESTQLDSHLFGVFGDPTAVAKLATQQRKAATESAGGEDSNSLIAQAAKMI